MSNYRDHFLRHIAQTSLSPDGFEVSHGDGIYLYDTQGKAYIDCISGIAVSSFGHRSNRIHDAILRQLDLHLHTSVYGEHIQSVQVSLAEKLCRLLPSPLDNVYFVTTGAEAVEGALKLARKYTNRYEIVACRRAYHGSTAGAESLRSDMEYTAASRPLVPGIRHIDFNNISDLARITRHTAAVICEPVQGEAGVILPETGYLEALRQRCNETGTLLILDEIQTGMGRTGSLFAFLQENVIPDILLAGKAFGAGMPLAAFISSKQIMQVLAENPMLGHITTFGGHPLSCAASLAALTWLEEEPIMEVVSAYGDLCRKTISAHPAVKEVRGKGHMMAVELHHPEKKLNVLAACRKEGLLLDWFLFNDTSIRFYPPLITTHDEMQMILNKWLTGLEEGR